MARIIITDDAGFMRVQLKGIFESLGHEVVGEAEDGKQAIDLYRKLKPDLVTMDITMPGMSGVEVVRKIVEYDPNAVIVMCSAMSQQQTVLKAIQAGAKDFIVKPFDQERVKQAIEKII